MHTKKVYVCIPLVNEGRSGAHSQQMMDNYQKLLPESKSKETQVECSYRQRIVSASALFEILFLSRKITSVEGIFTLSPTIFPRYPLEIHLLLIRLSSALGLFTWVRAIEITTGAPFFHVIFFKAVILLVFLCLKPRERSRLRKQWEKSVADWAFLRQKNTDLTPLYTNMKQ